MPPKKVKSSAPKRVVEKPEPETTLCVEPTTAPVKRERVLCTEECCIFDVYSQGLCHKHYKASQGFVFDEKKKLYVKGKKK